MVARAIPSQKTSADAKSAASVAVDLVSGYTGVAPVLRKMGVTYGLAEASC